MNAGYYVGSVINTEYGHAQTGTPRFRVYFAVNNGAGEEKIPGDIYLTDKAMGMARKSLKAIGFDPDKQDLDVLVNNPVLLTGNKAMLTIGDDYDQKGNLKGQKVQFINPMPKPPEKDELKKLSQALRDVKKKAKTVAVEADEPEDGGIPF